MNTTQNEIETLKRYFLSLQTTDNNSKDLDQVQRIVDGPYFKIYLNRPAKKNAFTNLGYVLLLESLYEARQHPATTITVITGRGDFFSSGNDLKTNFAIPKSLRADEYIENRAKTIQLLMKECVFHPKLLVAFVNGPSVGIATAMLPVCDLIYASRTATFSVPFASLALYPEFGTTVTFAQLMGHSKAVEFLLGRKLSATEAFERNLVTAVIEDGGLDFEKLCKERMNHVTNLSLQYVKNFKALMRRDEEKNVLLNVISIELAQQLKASMSKEHNEALERFAMRSRKSKI